MAQARRMAKDPRVRRLATEFACQWLHIYDFDSLDEKSPRHFPTFAKLRVAMHEEAILFFTDLFPERRLGALGARRRSYVLERSAGEALRHSRCHGPRVAARGRRQEVWAGRNSGPGGDACEAVGGLAHQPDSEGQLGGGGLAGRQAAAPAQKRSAASRR